MTDAISDTGKKKGRGRPSVGAVGIHVKLAPADLSDLDAWIDAQDDQPSRPEAVRRLIKASLS
ncbi:hypothetical protein CA262_08915 [Sphingobium sp. GW456-12-10-14-TSB1]|nr:hypothetical protein CA262_08915 [Sphingobium sp. GW456-12-10-14-TSB1]